MEGYVHTKFNEEWFRHSNINIQRLFNSGFYKNSRFFYMKKQANVGSSVGLVDSPGINLTPVHPLTKLHSGL
jgi:hypothetical protein